MLICGVGRSAWAEPAGEPSPEARAANAHALELDEAGKFSEALAEFQRAYDLSPSFRILYNVARTARLTQDFARSLTTYRRFLREGGADVDPPQRTIAEQQITELTALVGWVIVSGRSGTGVSFDRGATETLSVEPQAVNPGPHVVRAELGADSVERAFTVRAGETTRVDVSIDPVPKMLPTTPEPFRFPSVVTVAAWVTTGLFTGATVATGTAALALSSDLSDDVYVGPASTPAPGSPIASKAGRVDQLTTATNVLLGLAVASGAAAIAFSMIDGLAAPDADAKENPTPTVFLSPSTGGVIIWGAF
ncbi:MAG: hypothetical protein U0414_15795 [Polyangiaceae bacterium]